MDTYEKIVISASRRTDIPAFYMEWFMERIEGGFFAVQNPISRQVITVPATPEKVHTIVFWSKNYGPFLRGKYRQKLTEKGFHLFFHFTVNSEDLILEPNTPPLKERFKQAEILCTEFGSEVVSWRFDPICFYQNGNGTIHNNLKDFEYIAKVMSSLGIRSCITSFMDGYHKIEKRIKRIPEFKFIYPKTQERIRILLEMERKLAFRNIDLFTCCEKKLLNSLPSYSKIKSSSCIPNNLLQALFGGSLSLKLDYGQRRSKGCQCRVSWDIGSYTNQPCRNNCLYCYANPVC